jgi:3-deoxy-manno-octulosonate cytidylyltransferase (CMP-KDO synthetase)
MELAVVIPARVGSSRIPMKPYLKINERYLIDIIIERIREALGAVRIILASESAVFLQTFHSRDVEVVATDYHICSGTERAAVVSAKVKEDFILVMPCDIYFEESDLLSSYAAFCMEKRYECATLAKPLSSAEQLTNDAAVKMLSDRNGKGLYFSRNLDGKLIDYGESVCQQLGVYFYSREILEYFLKTSPTQLERVTNNESFRFLLNGRSMYRVLSDKKLYSLNTLEDLHDLEKATGMKVSYGKSAI